MSPEAEALLAEFVDVARRLPDFKRAWIIGLSQLSYPLDPPRCAKALGPVVAQIDLPDGAYTADSARHVARSKRRLAIPDFEEVEAALREWWADEEAGRHRVARYREPLPAPDFEPARERCTPEQARESIARNWPNGSSPSGTIERAVWKMLHNIAGEPVQ